MKITDVTKRLLITLGLLLCVFSTPSLSRAASVTVTYSYGLPMEEHPPEILELGLLPKFNKSLGTLIGARLEVFGSATGQLSYHNPGPSSLNAQAEAATDLIWNSGLVPLNDLLTLQNNTQSFLFSTGPVVAVAPGETVQFDALHEAKTLTFDLTPILPALQCFGNSTFDLSLQTLSGLRENGIEGSLNTFLNLTSAGGASITYSYQPAALPNPVPEPGAALLAGVALLGAVCRRRRC